MRVAILSDIHAAIAPFRSALDAARQQGFDVLLINGDLFTYGVEPVECLELVHEALALDDAHLILGNHDQMYLSLLENEHEYLLSLPDWIRESVEWTAQRIGQRWNEGLIWKDTWSKDRLLVSHANPFGPDNWRYLRSRSDMLEAARHLKLGGYRVGVFGHVHRHKEFTSPDGIRIATVGSLGQPREAGGMPEWTMLDYRDGQIEIVKHLVEFDMHDHIAQLHKAGLQPLTVSRLAAFFSC